MDYNDVYRQICLIIANNVDSEEEAILMVRALKKDLPKARWKRLVSDGHSLREEWKRREENRKREKEANRHVRILESQIRRAKRAGMSATFTLEQWTATLDHFQWKCAYCQERPFEAMEHVISISAGGGTTANNCIPTCQTCNNRKNNCPPHKLADRFPPEVIKDILQYLAQQ